VAQATVADQRMRNLQTVPQGEPVSSAGVLPQDVDALCVAAIDSRSICVDSPLSRRRRWTVIGADQLGDSAVVLVARRTRRGGLRLYRIRYCREDGSRQWRREEDWLGAECWGSDERSFGPRLTSKHSPVMECASSSDKRGGEACLRFGDGIVGYSHRSETRLVPEHGWIVVLWKGRRTMIDALAPDGRVVGSEHIPHLTSLFLD